jgi:hypothetical protein
VIIQIRNNWSDGLFPMTLTPLRTPVTFVLFHRWPHWWSDVLFHYLTSMQLVSFLLLSQQKIRSYNNETIGGVYSCPSGQRRRRYVGSDRNQFTYLF